MAIERKTQAPIIAATIARLEDGNYRLHLECASIEERLTIDTGELTESICLMAQAHGLKQKLVDAAAIARDTETGRAATPADKWAAIMEVYSSLLGGEWNRTRAAGEGKSGGLLARALLELYPGKGREGIATFLEGKSDKEKTALRNSAKVAAVIERLRAADGKAASVDTDAMLDELA